MKILFILLAASFLALSCQTTSSKIETPTIDKTVENVVRVESNSGISAIRIIDFQNYTFPWTKTFGGKEKSFSLKNGTSKLADGRSLRLKSLSYVNVADDDEEQALVNVSIDVGNATYEMLYVFALENGKPKLLESFEFGENNIYFGTAFAAHGELIIETYRQTANDAECCPSVFEISYYKWQKDKFILQDEPQKIPNKYVERLKRKI
jgi:hypothetical protein